MNISIKIERIAFLILLVLTCSAFSQECRLTLEDLQGSWYHSRFLDVLQTTKSVHQAVSGLYFVAFEITGDKQSETYDWLLIYNFHEGIHRQLTGISVVDDHTYSLECTDCYDENTHFQLVGTDVLRFSLGPEFKRIQNFANFVNELTVFGVCVDEQGQLYFFYKNGLSLWPDDKFNYEVGLDQVFFSADYIYLKNRRDESGYKLFYYFKATETDLEIYKAVYEDDIPMIDKESFLKLSKYEKEFYHYLDESRFQHLETQSKEQLNLLRNEIFARHRHSFDTSDMRSYFTSQPWYHEYKDHKVSIDELCEPELKVIKRIQNLEKNKK